MTLEYDEAAFRWNNPDKAVDATATKCSLSCFHCLQCHIPTANIVTTQSASEQLLNSSALRRSGELLNQQLQVGDCILLRA
jgi:hypothetical protein